MVIWRTDGYIKRRGATRTVQQVHVFNESAISDQAMLMLSERSNNNT
jgi:hypothetical protein